MAANPVGGTGSNVAERMGIKPAMIVMEIGRDEDSDEHVRELVSDATGEEFVDENSDEVVDIVLLWYRDQDGDLADILVDAIAPLADDGFIWLMTPRRGRPGHVEASEIGEAATIAGLSQTSITSVGTDWSAARLVGRKSPGARR